MRFVYCPTCGTKLVLKAAGDDGNIPYCSECQKYWFDSFSSVAIVMVVNEHNEIAMLKQNYLSDTYCTYVSGFMKPGETAEETAIREVQEELGLIVNKLEYAGTYWFADREQLMHGFIGYAEKHDFTLSSEVDQAEWVPFEKAPAKMFPERPGNSQHPIYNQFISHIKGSDRK